MTFADLLTAAMFDLGLLQEGEVPTANQQEMMKVRANDWLDSLPNQSLTVFSIARNVWTMTSAASYTVGTGGAINITRPVGPQAITNIGYINNNFPNPVEIPFGTTMSDDAYAAIPIKAFSSLYPTAFYYRPTYPLGTLIPYPIPSSSLLRGVIYTQQVIPEFAATSDTVSMAPGYRRYLRTSFALEVAAAFNAEPSAGLLRAFTDAESGIKRTNERLTDMGSDAADLFSGSTARSNIYTGP